MIANDSNAEVPLVCDFGGREVVACRLTDDTHTDASLPLPKTLAPRAFVIVLLK